MPRYRADVIFYFSAEDDEVPRRLRALAEAAEAVGFDYHGAEAKEGSEPEPDGDGWTRYAPLNDPQG